MGKIILSFLLVNICTDVMSAEKSLILHTRDHSTIGDGSFSQIDPIPSMILFKSIPLSSDWSQIKVNFRELHSKIDYSVWFKVDPNKIKNREIYPFLLSQTVNRFKGLCDKDCVVKEKIQDPYFCFGLIKHIKKELPDYPTDAISIELANFSVTKNGLNGANEWITRHFRAMAELECLRETYVSGLFGPDTESFKLYQEDDGFYTLTNSSRSYSIDLDWTWGSKNQCEDILDKMMESGKTLAIDLLFSTGKFSVNDVMNTERLFLVALHPKALEHLVEMYGFSINAKNADGNTLLMRMMVELRDRSQEQRNMSCETVKKINALLSNISLLLQSGADPEVRNNEGLNLYDIADQIKEGHFIKKCKIVHLLKPYRKDT